MYVNISQWVCIMNELNPFNFLIKLLAEPFIRSALIAAISSSIVGGIVGSYVVAKRIVFLSGSISHSVLAGLGAALYLKKKFFIEWLDPIYGALVAAILSAWVVGYVHLKYREREDTVIGALWACGMSIGVILIAITPGNTMEISNYLFGNILWSSNTDLSILILLNIAIITVVAFFHTRFLAVCFDETQARIQKISVTKMYFLLLSLVAITVVILIQVVGAILVISILSLPAAVASSFTNNLIKTMILAIIIGLLTSVTGMGFSFVLDWPPGATIAFSTTVVYMFSLICKNNYFTRA